MKKLVTTTISTDMFKSMIDGAADFLSILNNIVTGFDKMGMSTPLVVGTLGALFTSIKALGTKDGLNNGLIPIAGISKINQALKSQETQLVRSNGATVNYTKGLSNLSKGVSVASGSVAKASSNYKKYSVSTSSASISAGKLSSTINKTNKGFMSTATSMVAANAKNMLLNTGITLLNGAMIGLAVAGISMAVKALDNYINKAEKAAEKHKENIDAIQNDIGSYNSQKVAISEIAKEYDELSKKTDKSANDFRRLSELKGIIAETMPDLVIGYDSSNDPILKMNGSAEDLIKSLDEAIRKKQSLLADEQIANGYNALDILQKKGNGAWSNYQNDNMILDQAEGKINTTKQKVLSGLKSLNIESEKHYQKNLENYKKYMQDYKDTIIEENNVVREASLEIEETLAETRLGAIASLNKDNNFANLNEDVKQFAYELTNSLDFSSLSKSELSSYISNVKRALLDGNVDDVFKKYQDLRLELEKTGQYENYEKAVSSIVPELAKTLGLSEDMVKNMVEVPPYMKSATDAVDAYLQTFGKRSQMASFDEDTRNLIATYDTFTDLFLDLSNKAAYVEIDGVIQYNPEIISSILDNPGMPQEIKDAIKLMQEDGEGISKEEISLLLKLSFGYQLGDTEDGNQIVEEVQQEIDDKFGDKTVDVGNIKVKANYEVESQGKEKLEAEMKEFAQFEGRDDVKKKLIVEAVGMEEVQLYADIIKNLPTNTDYTNKFIIEQIGDLQELDSYKEVVEWIKANPEIAQKYNINVENLDKFTESANRLHAENGTTSTATFDIDSDGADETIDDQEEILANQDEINGKDSEVTVESNANATVEELKDLIEFSAKVEDGKYKLDFEATTTNAIGEIDNLTLAVGNLTKQFSDTPVTETTFKVNTSEAVTNVSTLAKEVDKIKPLLGKGYDTKFQTDTTVASKNVTGLKKNVDDYNTRFGGKTIFTIFKTDTSLASRNVTGLKTNVSDYVSKYAGKTFTTTFKTVKSNVTTSSSSNTGGGKAQPQSLSVQSAPTPMQKSSLMMSESSETPVLSTYASPEPIANSSVQTKESRNQVSTFATTSNTPISITAANTVDSVKYNIELLKELDNRIKIITNSLSALDTKMERAVGSEKIKYLQEQNNLYREQSNVVNDLLNKLNIQRSYLQQELKGKGFSFTVDMNISNYEEKLLEMERNAKRLEDVAKASSDKSSNYDGKDEKYKKSLENRAKEDREASEKYNETLSENKKLLQEYFDIHLDKLPDTSDEWNEINNKIKENSDLLEEINRQQRLFEKQNAVKELEYAYDSLSDKLDVIDIRLKNVYGQERLNLIQKQISLLKEQSNVQQNLVNTYQGMVGVYKEDLSKYGFNFNASGDMTNMDEILNKFKNHEDLEKVTDLVDEYINLQRDKLPDAIKEWENLNSAIKDAAKEKLDITKDIEDEITKIYKESIEKRKKLIDEELKKKLDALDKEKKAYQDYRDEVDYQSNYDDQLKMVQDLQLEYDKLSGDNSLGAKKKLEDLLKQINEEKKRLEDLVQEKIDSDINNMFDKESERLEENAEKEKEQIDKDFSDEKIKELVQAALNTGVFQEIDGTMRNLQDVMLEFVDEYGDGLSIIGDLLKNEMIANLGIAKDTMKDLVNIMKDLDLKSYSTNVGLALSSTTPYAKSKNATDYTQTIQFNSPLINIEGNVDKGLMANLESLEKNIVDKVCKEIVSKTNGR